MLLWIAENICHQDKSMGGQLGTMGEKMEGILLPIPQKGQVPSLKNCAVTLVYKDRPCKQRKVISIYRWCLSLYTGYMFRTYVIFTLLNTHRGHCT